MNSGLFDEPMIGTCYYPETLSVQEIKNDISLMKRAGVNVVRMGEKSWGFTEKKEGEYDFSLYHFVLQLLRQNSIKVIFAVPAAYPPVWLTEKYSDVLVTYRDRHSASPDTFNCACHNNPNFLNCVKKIVYKTVTELSCYDNIIAWQVDSPFDYADSSCFCFNCRAEFPKYLRKKYKKINALNFVKSMNFLNGEYESFESVPAPRDHESSSFVLNEWKMFQREVHTRYVKLQTSIIRNFSQTPVGAAVFPQLLSECIKIYEDLDVIFVNLDKDISFEEMSFWLNYSRGVKFRKFYVFESFTNKMCTETDSAARDFMLKTILPYSLGSDCFVFRLWRESPDGSAEGLHSFVSACSRPEYLFNSLENVSKFIDKTWDFLSLSRPVTSVAFQFLNTNPEVFARQKDFGSLDYMNIIIERFYRQITKNGIMPDISDVFDLQNYKLLFSPMYLSFDGLSFIDDVIEWVKGGGVWVFGPYSDIRDRYEMKYKNSPVGRLEALTGSFVRYVVSTENSPDAFWADGTKFEFEGPLYLLDPDDNENVSDVVFSGGSDTVLKDRSIIKNVGVGEGHIIILGAVPLEKDLAKLVDYAFSLSGILCNQISDGLIYIHREGIDDIGRTHKGAIICDFSGKKGSVYFEKGMLDVVSGKACSGKCEIEPFSVNVFTEIL